VVNVIGSTLSFRRARATVAEAQGIHPALSRCYDVLALGPRGFSAIGRVVCLSSRAAWQAFDASGDLLGLRPTMHSAGRLCELLNVSITVADQEVSP
jgi:hypothetical protein